MESMLELIDLVIIGLMFAIVQIFSEYLRYVEMKGQKDMLNAVQIEMRSEFKNSLQELKNAGTGLKTSLSRILSSVDIPEISMTEVALKELIQSPFMQQVLAKGADKLGVTGPGVPKVDKKPLAEQGKEVLQEMLTKEEFEFLEKIREKLVEKTA